MAKSFFGVVIFPGSRYKMNKAGSKKAKMVEPVDPVIPKIIATSFIIFYIYLFSKFNPRITNGKK